MGLRLDVLSQNHNTGSGLVQPMDQTQFAAYLRPKLLAEYVGKLRGSGAVPGNRYSARLVDDENVIIMIYYLDLCCCYIYFRWPIDRLNLLNEYICISIQLLRIGDAR